MIDFLKEFANGSYHIRTFKDDSGSLWFSAADICSALGLTNPSQAIGRLDDDEKSIAVSAIRTSGSPKVLVVNEPGMYALVLASRKPDAKAFKRWITHDVLPSIRQYGGYIDGMENLKGEDAAAVARQIMDLKAQVDKLTSQKGKVNTYLHETEERYDKLLAEVLAYRAAEAKATKAKAANASKPAEEKRHTVKVVTIKAVIEDDPLVVDQDGCVIRQSMFLSGRD